MADMGVGDTGPLDGAPLPTGAPTTLTMVVEGGTDFERPGDAVSSPDGTIFYFTAFTIPPADEDSEPAIFSVASDGSGGVTRLHAGDPLALPSGLVMSCDGDTLYIADMARPTPADEFADDGEDSDIGQLFTLGTAGGSAPVVLATTGISVPTGLALSSDCDTLYVTGWTDAGVPALFTLPLGGGPATVVKEGAPLVSPTGVHVDVNGIAWVLDHVAGDGLYAGGVLYSIRPDGTTTEVAADLALGTPGGVSLAAGGVTAVMPTVDADGNGQLITADTNTNQAGVLAAPMMVDPAGIRTARNAGVFVVVDSEGAIFRAE